MSGGGSGTSEQEALHEHGSPTDELGEALDRLTRRIGEVAEWAERASIPTGSPAVEEPETGHSPPADDVPLERPEGDHRDESILAVIASFREAGAIANGVFTSGGELTELDPVESNGRVALSGMLALLDLIPPQTVLEVRTTSSEWRAARVGDEAFALELRGEAGVVDQWLGSLLPALKD